MDQLLIASVKAAVEENTSNCEALREKVTELETNSIELNNQLKKLNEKKRKMDIQ